MFVLTMVAFASVAEATTYRLQVQTIGRATQFYRSDRRVVAPRTLTQMLNLSAFDLGNDQSGRLSAQLSVRYFSDFGLEQRLRDDPMFGDRWNATTLDLAYVNWRPVESLQLRLGRQWAMGVLGVRDFDGILVRWESPASGALASFVEIHGGRDVESGLTRWDPQNWDVQGLPVQADGELEGAPWHWMTGMQAGASVENLAHVAVGYRRRFYRGAQDKTVTGDERLGAAWTASPTRSLGLSASASYHTILGGVDTAKASAVWRLPVDSALWTSPFVSAGVEHRRPIFDSASIFNLFGAQPYQGVFASGQVRSESIATEFELRGWARMYHGEASSAGGAWLGNPGDSQAVGVAVAHRSDLRLGQRLLRWNSQISHQFSTGDSYGGDQFLGESRLRAPLGWQRIYLSGRALLLIAWPEHHRHEPGYAATGVLGADIPLGPVALLSLASEISMGSFYPSNSSLFLTFKLETGP